MAASPTSNKRGREAASDPYAQGGYNSTHTGVTAEQDRSIRAGGAGLSNWRSLEAATAITEQRDRMHQQVASREASERGRFPSVHGFGAPCVCAGSVPARPPARLPAAAAAWVGRTVRADGFVTVPPGVLRLT